MDELMQIIGKNGHHVFVRYDPVRDDNNFTIVIDQLRVADTDDPYGVLYKWLCKNIWKIDP